jgi:hypothetical protein
MTDDIVTRLREHALEGIWDFTKCSWDMQEAADEIERLRNQVRQLETERDQWQRMAVNDK